jgi:hypothetical protein
MVVGMRVVLGVCLAVSAVACAGSAPPPPPRDQHIVRPVWEDPVQQSRSSETTRLVQKPGLVYGDPKQKRDKKASSANKFPDAADGPFYGAGPGETNGTYAP